MLLQSGYHEERLAGLYLLVHFSKIKQYSISELAEFYMKQSHRINNWDLVDTSAEHII
jgi:3-methyladenine DNA glycosylase AlkD